MAEYDFSGWATRTNRRCSDGRTIMQNAFADDNGKTVPLVWNHNHNDPNNVLGHALLENREDGVYAYCSFNDTENAEHAKLLVQHGDIKSLSIYANQLKQNKGNVMHGVIREVSLVLAGANPGAYIDSIMVHGEMSDEEAVIYNDELLSLSHADGDEKEDKTEMSEETKKVDANESEETVADVFNTLTDKQKNVVYALIGQAVEDAKAEAAHSAMDEDDDSDEGGNDEMKHNVFENDETMQQDYISHAEMLEVIEDGKRYGSLKESALQHGIENIDYLFPDAKNLDTPPSWISREMGWVKEVLGDVHHTPFSRIKSMHADITEDEARARGYMKGNLKKEEVFGLLKRTTSMLWRGSRPRCVPCLTRKSLVPSLLATVVRLPLTTRSTS